MKLLECEFVCPFKREKLLKFYLFMQKEGEVIIILFIFPGVGLCLLPVMVGQ